MKWNPLLYDNTHGFVAKYGEGILEYLSAKTGETILDLGCGTGDLTGKISESGCSVVGIDSSMEMITKAKTKFPSINFHAMDARDITLNAKFDAIFSNAVLHWIKEPERVIKSMRNILKPNGRIVLEFGGKGNNEQMLAALRSAFIKRNFPANATINFWYYPSIGEYATALEEQDFRVMHAEHFDRQTPLTGPDGMKDWFRMFAANFFSGISETEKELILDDVQETLRKTHFINGTWYADYKRLRIVAVKN
jgi:trans-aconitate methyltransferase